MVINVSLTSLQTIGRDRENLLHLLAPLVVTINLVIHVIMYVYVDCFQILTFIADIVIATGASQCTSCHYLPVCPVTATDHIG